MIEGATYMMSNHTGSGMMASMTFHFSRTVPGGLLFANWRVQSTGELVGAVIAVFLLAILYEGLKTFREYLVFKDWQNWKNHRKSKRSRSRDSSESDGEEDSPGEDRTFVLADKRKAKKGTRRNGYTSFRYYSISVTMHLIQSALHVVQVGFAYLLMLIAMTYNGWLFLAVTFGAGVGYLLFAKSRHFMGNFREQNEHCNH